MVQKIANKEEFPLLTNQIYKEFEHQIRWGNSPDGQLATVKTKLKLEENPQIHIGKQLSKDGFYNYYVRLPLGKSLTAIEGFPLVVSQHGHGEPALLFLQKNGWEELEDQNKNFVLLCPDRPGNCWFLKEM